MNGLRTLIVEKPVALTGAIAMTLNALMILNVIDLTPDGVAAVNAMIMGWVGVLQLLVVPKSTVDEKVAIAHSSGYGKGVADTKTAVEALAPRKPRPRRAP